MGERRDLHAAFARRLEDRPDLADDRPAAATAELARHWAGADRPLDAYRAALAAAAAAEPINAFADAHRQLERAMELEPRLPTDARPGPSERLAIRRRAATMADLAGAPERSLELVREALALAEPMNDPMITGPLHSRLAFLMWAGGESEEALVEHHRAVELVPAEPPTVERAAVLGGLGGALMGLGRWSESRPICQAAIDCAQAAGAVLEESRARTMLGSDLVALGELDAGLEELREAHRLSDGEPSELAVVTGYNLALNLLATDHLEEALEVAGGTQETARSGGLERRYGMELAALVGDILLRLGRWDDADRATAEGLALDQRRRGTPYLAVVRSRLVARRGNIRDALDRLETIDADRLEPDLAVAHAIAVAEASVLGGRPDAALDAVDRGMAAATESGDRIWSAPLVGLGLAGGGGTRRRAPDEPRRAGSRHALRAGRSVARADRRAARRRDGPERSRLAGGGGGRRRTARPALGPGVVGRRGRGLGGGRGSVRARLGPLPAGRVGAPAIGCEGRRRHGPHGRLGDRGPAACRGADRRDPAAGPARTDPVERGAHRRRGRRPRGPGG